LVSKIALKLLFKLTNYDDVKDPWEGKGLIPLMPPNKNEKVVTHATSSLPYFSLSFKEIIIVIMFQYLSRFHAIWFFV